MTSKTISDAVTNISAEYIEKAADYTVIKKAKKAHKPVWFKWAAMAACLCLMVALFPLINSMINTETPDNPNISDASGAPVHFYLDGNLYIYHGEITQELPAGYEYIGEIKNVGDTFTGNDFEGNADGKIYMSEYVSDTAYFSWAEWNEEIDGAAPYLKLELEDTE